jgi:DNA primase
MKYPKEYLDEIKTRLKVSTVVSKSVALKKRGKEYVGSLLLKRKKLHHLLLMMKKNFIIVLQPQSMETSLTL